MNPRFDSVRGVAAPLRRANVDTDQIIPARVLTTLSREGLGANLFHALRFDATGAERADFVLNRAGYRAAKILVALDNFGCGSSREHAPWALVGFGIRCVIAPSFADIFATNCASNALLLVQLSRTQCDALLDLAAELATATWTVDLVSQRIGLPAGHIDFDIDANLKARLLAGTDEIQTTLEQLPRIASAERAARIDRPWLPSTRAAIAQEWNHHHE
jgi:3-isopropylmalate/(R)-2-methylmalate dehydratase small subunit